MDSRAHVDLCILLYKATESIISSFHSFVLVKSSKKSAECRSVIDANMRNIEATPTP